jgi:hypothetical protein
MDATGRDCCDGTPFEHARIARNRLRFYSAPVEYFRAAAAEEALFLRALRPIGGRVMDVRFLAAKQNEEAA